MFITDWRYDTSNELIDLLGGSADVRIRIQYFLEIHLGKGHVRLEPADQVIGPAELLDLGGGGV